MAVQAERLALPVLLPAAPGLQPKLRCRSPEEEGYVIVFSQRLWQNSILFACIIENLQLPSNWGP